MPERPYNLAIETSSRHGSVSLGRGDDLLHTIDLPPQQRHTVDLMPTIDRLFQRNAIGPRDLGEVYVSLGPGSFTGLRIGIATAKLLGQTLGIKLIGVPTLDVLAQNASPPSAARPRLLVALNTKRDTAYVGVFERREEWWRFAAEPWLLSDPLFAHHEGPMLAFTDMTLSPGVPLDRDRLEFLPDTLLIPRSEFVWSLGRQAARRGEFTEPANLLPLYARPPEAVELWDKRMGSRAIQNPLPPRERAG